MRSLLITLLIILFLIMLSPLVFGEEIRSLSFADDKGIRLSVMATTTQRAVYTNDLISADFIGTIINTNKYNVVSVGVTVHVMDCKKTSRNDCEYRGHETMWINLELVPNKSRQFKRRVKFYPSLKIGGKPAYSLVILGVLKS